MRPSNLVEKIRGLILTAAALAAAFAVGGVAVALYALSGEAAGRAALIGIGYIPALPISAAIPLIAIWVYWLIYGARTWIIAIIAIAAALFIASRLGKGRSPMRIPTAALRALREKASGRRVLAAVSTGCGFGDCFDRAWALWVLFQRSSGRWLCRNRPSDFRHN